MTGPVPGRGRPPSTFTPDAQDRYLAAVTTGARLGEAAALIGITADYPTRYARTHPDFAQQLAEAKAAGRAARIDHIAHGEYRYVHYHCRCPICTKAATTARAARPDRQQASPEPHLTPVPPTTSPPAASVVSFLLARAS